jgi:hypothetical protein
MFKVINLKPVKGEVPWSRLHEASYEAKPFASASIWSRVIQVHAVDAAGQVLVSRALPRDKFIAWCVQLPAGCIVAMEDMEFGRGAIVVREGKGGKDRVVMLPEAGL